MLRSYIHSLKSLKGSAFFTFKMLVLAGLLFYIFKDLDFGSFVHAYVSIPIHAYFVMVPVQISIQTFLAFRWKLLTLSSEATLRDYFGFVSLGNSLSVVSPSLFVSDGANAYFMGRRYKTVAQSMSSMFLGRLMGLIILLLCFFVSLPAHLAMARELQFSWKKGVVWLLLALVIGIGIGISAHKKYSGKLRKLAAAVLDMLKRPGILFPAFMLSIGIQLGQMVLVFLTYRFVGSPITFFDVLFVVPIVNIISIVPISVGQIGVREGISIFFLTKLPGITREHVLAASAFNYTLFIIFGLINAGLAFALINKRRA